MIHENKLFIYVAGPYTAKTPEAIQQNVDEAIDVADELIEIGLKYGVKVRPFIPHLAHYREARKTRHYEFWMEEDFDWIDRCDALFRMRGPSSGADREFVKATRDDMLVFRSLEDFDSWLASAMERAA